MWRSFLIDENSETIGSYITHIRQVAARLGYGEPQILEVLRNPFPSRLYWFFLPIEDLRQAVEITKRILTKERKDRQLAGGLTSAPFMSVQEGYGNNKRTVSFDIQGMLDNKIDTLTSMMSKLSTQGSNQNRPFNTKIYQGIKRGQGRNNYYDRDRQWDKVDQVVVIGIVNQITEINLSMDKTIEKGPIWSELQRRKFWGGSYKGAQNYRGHTDRREYRSNYGNSNFDRGRGKSGDRQYSGNFRRNKVRPRSKIQKTQRLF